MGLSSVCPGLIVAVEAGLRKTLSGSRAGADGAFHSMVVLESARG
jgi:hypothetical protein